MPTQALTPRMKVLLWPFRMPGLAVTTLVVVLLVLWLMSLLGNALGTTIDNDDLGAGLAVCLATLLLGLYALVMSSLIRVFSRIFAGHARQRPARLGDLPLTYFRTCQDCQYTWAWDPEATLRDGFQPQAPPTARTSAPVRPVPAPRSQGRSRVPFTCPMCGAQSNYDPWLGPAKCPECDYSPSRGKKMRTALQRARVDAYLPYLRDYFDHWDGVEPLQCSFDNESPEAAQASFRSYQTALGEALHPSPGFYYSAGYFRQHNPTPRQVLDFVEAYGLLRRGQGDLARERLQSLTTSAPQFVEPWLWLAALEVDPRQRIMLIERACSADPAHPLAVDIRAIGRGEVAARLEVPGAEEAPRAETHPCSKCGGKLHYEPGARQVECVHCGSTINLRLLDILNRPAPHVSAMRLRRKVQSRVWRDLERIVSCDACGSRISMSDRFAKECAFCGSDNVLVQDLRVPLHKPDALLPFAIGADEVAKRIQQGKPSLWSSYKGWRAYRDLVVERVVGLYLPFWVFDGVVEPIWAWLGKDGALSRISKPETPLPFVDLLIPGTERPLPSHIDQVADYDILSVSEYQAEKLADWPAMLYDLDVEDVVEDAYEAMITLAHAQLGPPILVGEEGPPGARAVRTLQVSQTTYQLVLLPLWIAALRSRAGNSMAWINGQTGTTLISFLGTPQGERELLETAEEQSQRAPRTQQRLGK